jgi:3-oxoacyl-[acyl-carrier protein] reductase
MDLNLSGKTALVCGSTQGIGKAVAVELAELGANIVLVARNEISLRKVVAELKTTEAQKHGFLVADFSNPAELKKSIEQYLVSHSGIDILVNNTGGPAAGPVEKARSEEFISAFTNHLICNHVLAQACLGGMKKNKFGRIINIISTSVKQPLKGLGVSNTIRAAVANWSKTLSAEVAEFGITVNNVLPGATSTQRLDEIISNKSSKSGIAKESVTEDMIKEIPAKRFAQPKEIAAAVAFLSSPSASYITGINLPVDGGRTGCL